MSDTFWADMAAKETLTEEDFFAARDRVRSEKGKPDRMTEERKQVLLRFFKSEVAAKFIPELREKEEEPLERDLLEHVYTIVMHPKDLDGSTLWQVRLWDGMDGEWIDIGPAQSPLEALREWHKRTDGGKEKVHYSEIDYFRIFPAGTKMAYSGGHAMNRDDGAPAPEPIPIEFVQAPKPRRYWSGDLAQRLVTVLEKSLATEGWHIALAGSVLHQGESHNDLDIIVYPHRAPNKDFDIPRKVFAMFGMELETPVDAVHKKWAMVDASHDRKHVEVWKWHHLKIDVFFLQ